MYVDLKNKFDILNKISIVVYFELVLFHALFEVITSKVLRSPQ
jgi:hypothetical protein